MAKCRKSNTLEWHARPIPDQRWLRRYIGIYRIQPKRQKNYFLRSPHWNHSHSTYLFDGIRMELTQNDIIVQIVRFIRALTLAWRWRLLWTRRLASIHIARMHTIGVRHAAMCCHLRWWFWIHQTCFFRFIGHYSVSICNTSLTHHRWNEENKN